MQIEHGDDEIEEPVHKSTAVFVDGGHVEDMRRRKSLGVLEQFRLELRRSLD